VSLPLNTPHQFAYEVVQDVNGGYFPAAVTRLTRLHPDLQTYQSYGWNGSCLICHESAAAPGHNGDGASVLDFNHDLRMDVLVSNGRARWPGQPALLQNVFATKHAAAVRLRGPAWNPLGMGAMVELRTSNFTYRRQLNDGVAWNGQSDVSFVHLGLRGLTAGVARVNWPDGTLDCVAVAAETVVELQFGTSPCP